VVGGPAMMPDADATNADDVRFAPSVVETPEKALR
jgi:hypothetical protein